MIKILEIISYCYCLTNTEFCQLSKVIYSCIHYTALGGKRIWAIIVHCSYCLCECLWDWIGLVRCFRITYLGTTYHVDGTSTWRYYVKETASGPECTDLSNWMLGLPDCAPIYNINAAPEPWEYVQPNFRLWGIKWGTGAGFSQGEFQVTVDGHWAVGETHVGIKSGDGIDIGPLAGPIRDTYALSGKIVEPTAAGLGDTLTYTIVVNNAGPGDAAGLRIVDPIPEGTVYIWDSAQASSGEVYQSSDGIHPRADCGHRPGRR